MSYTRKFNPWTKMLQWAIDTRDGIFKLINNLNNTVFETNNNGRVDQYAYSDVDGAIHVLHLVSDSPSDGKRIGHYAFRAKDEDGIERTWARFSAYIRDVSKISLNSQLSFDFFLDADGSSGTVYPNKSILIDKDGVDFDLLKLKSIDQIIVDRSPGKASITNGLSGGQYNLIIDAATGQNVYIQHYKSGNLFLCSGGGNVIFNVPKTTPSLTGNSQMAMSLDETGHNIMFTVKYSDGTSKSATLALS